MNLLSQLRALSAQFSGAAFASHVHHSHVTGWKTELYAPWPSSTLFEFPGSNTQSVPLITNLYSKLKL